MLSATDESVPRHLPRLPCLTHRTSDRALLPATNVKKAPCAHTQLRGQSINGIKSEISLPPLDPS